MPTTEPTKPIASIKEASEGAQKRAGVKCRFHDLKHTAVSRMLDAGVQITKIATIVDGPQLLVRMSARYGHFGLEDRRSAVETISSPIEREIDQGSPVNPPGNIESTDAKIN